ncbi:hypothetical protein A9974_20105 [Achromobacter sp. UMC71]|nr:hypothetical protein [Achromobacter sp. UMC71]
MGGGATVNYGKIKRNLLRAADAAALPPQQRSVTITCDQPAAIALQQSNREGLASPAAGSKLGLAPEASHGIGLASGRPLGAFALRWRREGATLDGIPAPLIVSSDGGATWRLMDADTVVGATDLIAWSRGEQRRPASGRTLTVSVRIETAIAPTSTLYLGREALLDGSISLSAIFQ